MINLLSDERKDAIKAARTNVIIMRYMGIITLAFLFISGVLAVSYTVLQGTKQSAEQFIETNQVQADEYSETQQAVSSLSSSLSETRETLSQEIRYSELLVNIGQLMPQGTILDTLTLTTSSFNGEQVKLIAYAKSTTEASQLQGYFQTSQIFSAVNLDGTEDNATEVSGYPVRITLSVTLNRVGNRAGL